MWLAGDRAIPPEAGVVDEHLRPADRILLAKVSGPLPYNVYWTENGLRNRFAAPRTGEDPFPIHRRPRPPGVTDGPVSCQSEHELLVTAQMSSYTRTVSSEP